MIRQSALRLRRGALVTAIVGSVLTAAAYWLDRADVLVSWLFVWLFFLGIALGSMVNVMIHELTGGEWGFAVRAPAEAAMATLPVLALLGLPLAFGLGDLYPWAREDAGARHWYLNTAAFGIRAVVYFALWIWVSVRDVRSEGTSWIIT